jgi:hypothetical protein
MTPRFITLVLLGTSLAIAGCRAPQSSLTELSLEIKSGGQPGTYKLSGASNLPDGTRLTVQGLRQLSSVHAGMAADSRKGFSILDQQVVPVTEGRWETSLSLWNTATDGAAAESWQIDLPGGARNFTADAEVIFTATTPPSKDAKGLEQQWDASKNNPEGQQVGFTADGRWYLRARKTLDLAPPEVTASTVKAATAAIAIRPEQATPDRLEIDPAITDPSLAKPMTDEAPTPQEILR